MIETHYVDGGREQPSDLRGRKLMVLGSAGLSKPGLFRAAARRGLRLIFVKADATWEKDYCDDVLPINCTNYENIGDVTRMVVEFATQHQAEGVTTTFDAAIPVLARVSQELRMVGLKPEVADVIRNKLLMRQRFDELGLPSARSIQVLTWPDCAAAVDELKYPVVVKPIMGTGSAGVVLATNYRELRWAYERSRRVAHALNGTGHLLIEEYLDGVEVCVDAIVHRGEVLFQNITDNPQHRTGLAFEGNEYVTPTSLPEGTASKVYDLNIRTLRGLGFTDTIGHTEMRITRSGARLIEVHPRIAGHRMPEIVRSALNVDLFEAAIDVAMNARPVVLIESDGYASYRCVCSPKSGRLNYVHGIDAARRLPGIQEVELVIEPGNDVKAVPDAVQQNIAFILAHGQSYQSVRERTAAALEKIRLDVI